MIKKRSAEFTRVYTPAKGIIREAHTHLYNGLSASAESAKRCKLLIFSRNKSKLAPAKRIPIWKRKFLLIWFIDININYYSVKIFPQFWLTKSTRIIHHNQLMMTKFGRILCLTRKWRQKCSLLQVNAPLTEKTWGRDWAVFVVKTKMAHTSYPTQPSYPAQPHSLIAK